MSAFTLTVESDDLARIFTNALAFFPARSIVKTALLRVYGGSIEATGTDTYTVGRDWCEVREWNSEAGAMDALPIVIELDREGWADIEKQARADKGKTGRLEFTPGDALVFRPGGQKAENGVAQDMTGKLSTKLTNSETLESREVWQLCDELLERMAERPMIEPHVIAFDPDLFTRFHRVKPSGDAEKVIDFLYQGEGNPMLAKIGPTFVGAIMPIDRATYAANQDGGQDALW